jgi:hypothetical protein
MIDLTSYDVPPQSERCQDDEDDIETAWKILRQAKPGTLLDSTEGHLAVLRALRCGRAHDWL